MAQLNINSRSYFVDAAPDTPLLWALREDLRLTGTKFGCGRGHCGCCTVHINGEAMRSCQLRVGDVEGTLITTIEGLDSGTDHPIQKAWIEEQVAQCGYCQSGMIMAVTAMLDERPHPSDEQIDATITNICRCGTFARVRRAIHAVSDGKEGRDA